MTPLPGIYASQISGKLWQPQGAYDSLASVTLSATTASVTFAGIPTGYKHLKIIGIAKAAFSNSSVGTSQYKIQFNGDAGANYSVHQLYGNGTSAVASGAASQNQAFGNAAWGLAGGLGGNVYVSMILDILDYSSNTKNKTLRILEGFDANSTSTNQFINLRSHDWYSTSPITSILLDSNTPYADGPFAANTQFALYGVK